MIFIFGYSDEYQLCDTAATWRSLNTDSHFRNFPIRLQFQHCFFHRSINALLGTLTIFIISFHYVIILSFLTVDINRTQRFSIFRLGSDGVLCSVFHDRQRRADQLFAFAATLAPPVGLDTNLLILLVHLLAGHGSYNWMVLLHQPVVVSRPAIRNWEQCRMQHVLFFFLGWMAFKVWRVPFRAG